MDINVGLYTIINDMVSFHSIGYKFVIYNIITKYKMHYIDK